jgi:hypothetical protein
MTNEQIVEPTTPAATVEPATTPTPELTPPAVTAEPATVTELTPEPTEPKEPEPKESKVVQELKDQRRKRQEAERREQEAAQQAAYWKGIAEGRKPTESPVTVPSLNREPIIGDFPKWDDWNTAHNRWEVQQALTKAKQEESEKEAQTRFIDRRNEVLNANPDIVGLPIMIDQFWPDQKNPLTGDMAKVIIESEVAAKLIRYLDEHSDEARKLCRMNPVFAAKELGKIEMKLTSVPKVEPKKVSQAPEPIQTVGTKGVVTVDDDSLPIEAVIAKRNQAQYKVRR